MDSKEKLGKKQFLSVQGMDIKGLSAEPLVQIFIASSMFRYANICSIKI